MKKIDWTGKRKGQLEALFPDKGSSWVCKCDCGNIKLIPRFSGTSAKSCGCLHSPNDQIYHNQLQQRIKNNSVEKENGCWEWIKHIDKAGYSMCTYRQKQVRGHRVSWLAFKGQIPTNMFVCHKCDNRKCVNPDHLFLGNYYDNLKDMLSKNRNAKGSKSGNAKLKESDILQIRSMYDSGHYTQKQIGNIYNIRQNKISAIVNRKTWKHI